MSTRMIIILTPREKQLYDTLEEAGGWLSRNEIARKQDKYRLSPHDFDLLDRLADKGVIEKDLFRVVEDRGKGAFIYRAIPIAEGKY